MRRSDCNLSLRASIKLTVKGDANYRQSAYTKYLIHWVYEPMSLRTHTNYRDFNITCELQLRIYTTLVVSHAFISFLFLRNIYAYFSLAT